MILINTALREVITQMKHLSNGIRTIDDKYGRQSEGYAKRRADQEFSCLYLALVADLGSRRVSPWLTIQARLPHMIADRKAMMPQKRCRIVTNDMLQKLEHKTTKADM